MNRKILIVGVAMLGLACLCLVFALAGGSTDRITNREKPTVQPTLEAQESFDECVRRCVDAARDANIERDDITDEDYQIIIAEHKNYICPGKCEQLK